MRKGWKIRKLSDLFSIKSSRRVHQSDWKSSGIPFYRAREVVKLAKKGHVSNELFISQELYDEYTKNSGAPKAGDFIVSAVGTLGQCYLVKDSDKFYFKDASVLWFENLGNVNSRYIEYSFMSDPVIAQIMDGSMGATVGTLTISRAKDIEIPIPALPEQEYIVAILDEVFAAISKVKTNIEQNLKNAKELFESYLQGIFENKDMSWEKKTLGEIALVKSGGTPSRGKKEYWDGDIAWYSSGELNDLYTKNPERYINELAVTNSNAKLFPKGSLLIGMYDTAALKMSIIDRDATFNQAIAGVKPNDQIDLIFVLHSINSIKPILLNLRRGVRQKNLSLEKIKNIPIYIPALKSQQTIVVQLDKLSAETRKLEIIYQKKINDLEELKKSILQKAFNGELKTSNLELAI